MCLQFPTFCDFTVLLSFENLQNCVKRGGHILDIQKVASVGTISVKGQLLASHQLIGKLWNQFFRKLVGSVDVVPTGDQAGQLETSKVTLDQEFGPGLGGGVGVGRFQNVFLRHGIRFEIFSLSIDLVRRNVNESLDGGAIFGTLQQNVRSHNVGLGKGQGVTKGIVDVGLCRKVHNSVNLVFQERIVDNVWDRNVSLDEFEVGKVL